MTFGNVRDNKSHHFFLKSMEISCPRAKIKILLFTLRAMLPKQGHQHNSWKKSVLLAVIPAIIQYNIMASVQLSSCWVLLVVVWCFNTNSKDKFEKNVTAWLLSSKFRSCSSTCALVRRWRVNSMRHSKLYCLCLCLLEVLDWLLSSKLNWCFVGNSCSGIEMVVTVEVAGCSCVPQVLCLLM